jgi:hypothetical protein
LLHKKNADQQRRGAIRGEKLLLPWWANFLSTGQQADYPVSKDNKTPACDSVNMNLLFMREQMKIMSRIMRETFAVIQFMISHTPVFQIKSSKLKLEL